MRSNLCIGLSFEEGLVPVKTKGKTLHKLFVSPNKPNSSNLVTGTSIQKFLILKSQVVYLLSL